jgi:CubicO group peptidase (beta-lactamase class C family)
MKTLRRRLLTCLILSATHANISSAAPDRFDSVRELIRRKLEQIEAPSIAVAVARDGKVELHRGDPIPPNARDEAHRRHGLDLSTPLESRVNGAPASVLK